LFWSHSVWIHQNPGSGSGPDPDLMSARVLF
jgi:hypothetical protein